MLLISMFVAFLVGTLFGMILISLLIVAGTDESTEDTLEESANASYERREMH